MRSNTNARECVARLRLAPFILCGATAIQLALITLLPCEAVSIAAQIICTSPILCLLLAWIGRPFRFCAWWHIEALLPIVPATVGILAHYDIGNVYLWLASSALVLVGSIGNGIMVYIKNETT